MMIEEKVRKSIEEDLQKLTFVNWDRLVQAEGQITIFGWIDREKDAYKDFVVLRFSPVARFIQKWFVATSSKKYSKLIGEILGTGHATCERAEHWFRIPNVIKEVKK